MTPSSESSSIVRPFAPPTGTHPRTDGPTRIPAINSPMTGGCSKRSKTSANTFAAVKAMKMAKRTEMEPRSLQG
jgi:hypothetical protein